MFRRAALWAWTLRSRCARSRASGTRLANTSRKREARTYWSEGARRKDAPAKDPGKERRNGTHTHIPGLCAGRGDPCLFTCEGRDISPALEWAGTPDGTKSLVLIVDDPDAPDPEAPKRTWVHWVLFNLPPSSAGLPEAVAPGDLPPGTLEGTNDWKRTAYGGPCPPIGRHRYYHKLSALDVVLPDLGTPTRAEVEAAMAGHVLAQAELLGTYQKKDGQ